MNEVNSTYLDFTHSFIRAILKSARQNLAEPQEQHREHAMADALRIFEIVGNNMSLNLREPNWELIRDEVFCEYLKRVFKEIRKLAANTECDLVREPDGGVPYDGYVAGLMTVLTIMQTNAKSLGLDRSLVDLDEFDPMRSDLAPYRDPDSE